MLSKPIPPAPIKEQDKGSPNWTRWFNLVSSNVTKIYDLSATITPSSIPAQTTVEQTFTVNGIVSSDRILELIKPTNTAGIGIVGKRVTANNTVAIDYINVTAAPITPPSETYTFILIK